MADYLELPGGSVWYDERGAGDPLVLVHGGAVDLRFFDHNVGPLAERFRVITTDLWGHGRTADRDGDLIGGKGGVSDEQVEQTVAFLGASYGEVSPDGEEHFPVVVRKDFELSTREPALTAAEIGAVRARTLVMAADDDIISLEHTLELYRAIPDSELSVMPGTSHFLLQEKPAACNAILLDFLANDPVATVAPIRRAPLSPRVDRAPGARGRGRPRLIHHTPVGRPANLC